MQDIIVIGFQRPEEVYTLYMLAQWLEEHRPGYQDLARRLKFGDGFDVYDMTTQPEKGDALDAIGADTAMVVALHLFGIDKLPGGNTARVTEMDPRNCYNRDNIRLLELCMKHGVPLIAVGDQPWMGLEKRTLMYGTEGPLDPHDANALNDPLVYLYEKKAARYFVFNETDGIYAHPRPMARAKAEKFIAEFPKRFLAQGYYASAAGRIPVSELRLSLVAEDRA